METQDPKYVDEIEGSEVPALAAGAYQAELMQLEEIETQFGPARRWHWRIAGAADDGTDFLLTAITSPFFTKGSKGNRIVRALRGTPLSPGERVALADLAGKSATLNLGVKESGYNCVLDVSPPVKAKPAAPVPTDTDELAAFQEWKAAQAAQPEPPLPSSTGSEAAA